MPCEQTLVFDSSALIHTKRVIRVDHQWAFFDGLLKRLRIGAVVVPRYVMKEMSEVDHPDMPGAWAAGTYLEALHINDPDYEWVQVVMSRTPDVIEVDSEMNKADPWVLALALQLRNDGVEAVVVTDDTIDRPSKISLASACDFFGVEWMDLTGALDWLERHPPEYESPA